MCILMPPIFAEVIFPQRVSQSFTYWVPASWHESLKVGHWVLAPFGRTARPGFVVTMSEHPSDPTLPENRIRELEEHLTTSSDFEVDPTLIALAEWMADYYIAPLGVCFQLIQPPRLPFKTSSRLQITPLGQQAMERGRLSDSAKTLLEALNRRAKGLTLASLKKVVTTASTTVTQLKRKKWLEEIHTYTVASGFEELRPDAKTFRPSQSKNVSHREKKLTDGPSWWKDFQQHLTRKSFGEYFTNDMGRQFTTLLGRMIRETHHQKRTALIILPDINQATSWAHILRTDLGIQVGIFHSGLTNTARMKEWQAINQRRYQVVVGTRSAVFVPIPSLGLMCLIHEEDFSFKDEQSPYFHTREVARERARLSHGTLLLHSPHPSLETVHHFSTATKPDTKVSCEARSEENSIQVVDHHHIPYGTTISHEMRQGIEQALSAGGGIVIFHNRKGFSSSIVCRDCGTAAQCASCQIPFGLLTAPPQMRCPYCGTIESVPVVCPACSGSLLEPSGFGTERLEQEFRREFPDATVGRLDRNNVRTEAAAQSIRSQFRQGAIQILIGTEMLFHGTPLSPVRFVGIPYADAGLHLPDFRSAERLYHHLQSAMNLLTDHCTPHQVVIQTRLPSHHVMQAIARQQPSFFYDHELAFREAIGYPPFIHFIQMTVSGKTQALVQEAAGQWVQALANQVAHSSSNRPFNLAVDTTILGPIASQALKHRSLHRETILFKAADADQARTAIRRTYETMSTNKCYKGLQFGINVDPREML